MSKSYDGDWVLRSVLFVPGHLDSMLRKAAKTDADALVLDLEDAVPESSKSIARDVVRDVLNSDLFIRHTLFVRINSFETGLAEEDLKVVITAKPHGIVYPWANRPEEIKELDAILSSLEHHRNLPENYFSIIAVIESPLAVLNVSKIAVSSSRLVALIFGCEDFLAELQGRHSRDEIALMTPRALVAMTARAAGIEAIDTPYVKVKDIEGLKTFAETGRTLGMSGMCALTPDQVKVINEIYTPAEDERQFAQGIVDAADECEQSGRGVCIVNGKFISPPTIKAARKTLARIAAIHNKEEYFNARSAAKFG